MPALTVEVNLNRTSEELLKINETSISIHIRHYLDNKVALNIYHTDIVGFSVI